MKNGIIKNSCLMFVLVTVQIFMLDKYQMYLDVAIVGLLLSNVISMIENLNLMGVEIPEKLLNMLSQNKTKNEVEKDERKEED